MWNSVQYRCHQVREFFQRGALVRRAEVEGLADRLHPGSIAFSTIVTSAAQDQSTHAVADQNQFVDRFRIGAKQIFKHDIQRLAVNRNRQAGVVAQIKRGVTKIVL